MSQYTIFRIQKLKDLASIRRSMKHAFRAQTTPNADPERLSDNTHFFHHDVAHAMQAFKMRLPQTYRKNAVLAVEFLITASPEIMAEKSREEQDAYFADALTYLQDKHGVENVVYAGIHRDETTPHMYAYVVPLDERQKLNCNLFYGKPKALSDLQTDFHLTVGQPRGFERGIKGSKAKHTSIKSFYARTINAVEDAAIDLEGLTIEPPAPSLASRFKPSEYGQQVVEVTTRIVMAQANDKIKALQLLHQSEMSAVKNQAMHATADSRNAYIREQWKNEDLEKDIGVLKQQWQSQQDLNHQVMVLTTELNSAETKFAQTLTRTQTELNQQITSLTAKNQEKDQLIGLFTEDEIAAAQCRHQQKLKAAKEKAQAEEKAEQQRQLKAAHTELQTHLKTLRTLLKQRTDEQNDLIEQTNDLIQNHTKILNNPNLSQVAEYQNRIASTLTYLETAKDQLDLDEKIFERTIHGFQCQWLTEQWLSAQEALQQIQVIKQPNNQCHTILVQIHTVITQYYRHDLLPKAIENNKLYCEHFINLRNYCTVNHIVSINENIAFMKKADADLTQEYLPILLGQGRFGTSFGIDYEQAFAVFKHEFAQRLESALLQPEHAKLRMLMLLETQECEPVPESVVECRRNDNSDDSPSPF